MSNGTLSRGQKAPIIVLAVPTFDANQRLTGLVTGVLRLDELRPSVLDVRSTCARRLIAALSVAAPS